MNLNKKPVDIGFFRVNDPTSGLFRIKGEKADFVILGTLGLEFDRKAHGHRFFRVNDPTSGLFRIKGGKADFVIFGAFGVNLTKKPVNIGFLG